jgi:hypothetical protein
LAISLQASPASGDQVPIALQPTSKGPSFPAFSCNPLYVIGLSEVIIGLSPTVTQNSLPDLHPITGDF